MKFGILLSHFIYKPRTEGVIQWEDLRNVNEFYCVSINEIFIQNTIYRTFKFNRHVSFHCYFLNPWLYLSNFRVFFKNFIFAYTKIWYSSRYASVSIKYFLCFIYILLSLIVLNFSKSIVYSWVCAIVLFSFVNYHWWLTWIIIYSIWAICRVWCNRSAITIQICRIIHNV